MDPSEITAFWLDEIEPAQWWKKDPDFDAALRRRFGGALAEAASGGFEDWIYGADATAWSRIWVTWSLISV